MATNTWHTESQHRMVGNPLHNAALLGQRLALTGAQVAEFRERGFVRGPRVLDDSYIAALREGLAANSIARMNAFLSLTRFMKEESSRAERVSLSGRMANRRGVP